MIFLIIYKYECSAFDERCSIVSDECSVQVQFTEALQTCSEYNN